MVCDKNVTPGHSAIEGRERAMNILILGASRGTGALCVQEALGRGHSVSAFARSPQNLKVTHERLKLVTGDFHNRESVDGAVKGHDAVIITASATSMKAFKENANYFSEGTGYAIDSMKAHGVKRLVILSALGTGESRKLSNFLVDKLLISFLLKRPFEDHERQEKLTMQSGLQWVIARPGRLTDGPAHRKYVKTANVEPVPGAISRADVADFLVEAAVTDAWLNKAVQLGG